jgi:hypothetical protein
MKIPGTWAPIIKEDGTIDEEPNIFHIQDKDKLRQMVDSDPDCNGGESLKFFLKLMFNKKLARTTEPDEEPVPNEKFIITMIEDYNKNFKKYGPGIVEKRILERAEDFFIALYRVDSAYTERMGGIISYLIAHHVSNCNSLNGDYIDALIDTHEWWKESDFRERSFAWIDWGFKFAIKKYRTNKFYKKSINHMLLFINLNKRNWAYLIIFDPKNWYPFGRGMECNLINGGNF